MLRRILALMMALAVAGGLSAPAFCAASYAWPGGHVTLGATSPSDQWYFAEGCTRPGFDAWLCVMNPQTETALVDISFLTPGGQEAHITDPLPPLSRYTINVAEVVGEDKDVSLVVESDLPVVAERPMYFNYHGMRAGGHVTLGATSPSDQWYFAEGCTRPGFDAWLCVMNPQTETALVDISFLTPGGQEAHITDPLPPLSRYTINVAEVVGEDKDVSLVVESDLPVVAERPMYFNYHGMRAGGHVTLGATSPSDQWYFAEGCTRPGFDAWLCVMNPQTETALVDISFLTPGGQEAHITDPLPPLSRYTINVAEVVGEDKDVSLVVESDLPVVAERPMYFNYHGMRAGGHVTLGATSPSDQWYFAEGCTRPGFDAWLCVMNPQTETALVDISFLTPGGQEAHITDPLPPLSRYTINVAEVVGEDKDVSLVVESDLPVVAERPMYFGYLTPRDSTAYLFAESSGLELICPVSYQETIGIMYHEASRWDIHNREAQARALIPLGGCVGDANPSARVPGWTPQRWGDPYYWVQESRGRGTWSTSAVDVGAKVGCRAVSPVDGVVETSEAFNLYGIYPDTRLAIIPDGRPDLRVVLLHLEDIRVASGTRVKAGETVVGRVRPLSLYFQSDIGSDYTGDEGNHVHLQINLAPAE